MGSTVFPPAASGPTLSEITSAGNSAGWGASGDRNWTLVASHIGVSASDTISFTGLSGYKFYKIEFLNLLPNSGSGASVGIFINNNNSAIYSYGFAYRNEGGTSLGWQRNYNNDRIYFMPGITGNSSSNGIYGNLYINNCNNGIYKNVTWETGCVYSGYGYKTENANGYIATTSDVTSIQIWNSIAAWATGVYTQTGVRLWGSN